MFTNALVATLSLSALVGLVMFIIATAPDNIESGFSKFLAKNADRLFMAGLGVGSAPTIWGAALIDGYLSIALIGLGAAMLAAPILGSAFWAMGWHRYPPTTIG